MTRAPSRDSSCRAFVEHTKCIFSPLAKCDWHGLCVCFKVITCKTCDWYAIRNICICSSRSNYSFVKFTLNDAKVYPRAVSFPFLAGDFPQLHTYSRHTSANVQLVSEIRKELNNSQCTEGEKKRARSILAHVFVFLYPHHTQRFFFIVQTMKTFSMFYMAQKRNCSQHIYGDVSLAAHILCSQHGLNKSYVYVKQ